MAKNGMAMRNTSTHVSLSSLPDPKTEYTISFSTLSGGLNLYDLDTLLETSESPDIRNLRWKDGALGCRQGQSYSISTAPGGTGYSCYEGLFHGSAFLHIGTTLYRFDPSAATPALVSVLTGVPALRGVWFRYNDNLYYKVRGGFWRITYADGAFSAASVATGAYTPITYINTDPESHAGDEYQPENRLSAAKTVWYDAKELDSVVTYTATASQTDFYMTDMSTLGRIKYVNVNDTTQSTTAYTVVRTASSCCIQFTTGLTEGDSVEIYHTRNVKLYHLPVTNVDSVDKVTVDGTELTPPSPTTVTATATATGDSQTVTFSVGRTGIASVTSVTVQGSVVTNYTADLTAGTVTFRTAPYSGDAIVITYTYVAQVGDYTVDLVNGTVTFTTAPTYPDPFVANTVKITYSKANATALNNILNCRYAQVFGGDQNACIVLGGDSGQPNAYYWNGNNTAMDDSYWPMEQYNLAGDASEEITGFGTQQSLLVVFKTGSIGKATFGTTTTTSDRLAIQMPYTAINSRLGCDVPGSIQLIENNLVFCNSRQGVHMILDSSDAEENNVVLISRKVNGSDARPGIFYDVKQAGDTVCSWDDEECYWLCANGHVYLWDYTLSTYKNPSWFYYTNVAARGLFRDDSGSTYHMDGTGKVTKFTDEFSDYGSGIDKVYQFATQIMGSFDRLKDVRSVLFNVRSDTDSETAVRYETDWETRYDLTPLRSFTYRVAPRNLAYRYLGVQKFSHVERRKPGCRHVRHFSMRLENSVNGQDLSLLSAQVQFVFQGRER